MMETILFAVIGLMLIGLVLYLGFKLKKERAAQQEALSAAAAQNTQQNDAFSLLQTHLEGLQRNLLLSQKEFENSFESKTSNLRSEMLNSLQASREELLKGLNNSSKTMEEKVSKMDERVESRLGHIQNKVQDKLELNIKEGFKHFSKIQEHLTVAGNQLENLNTIGESINDLNSLLKLPHLRGSFGEATLERILSDLLPTHAFELQYQISPNSTERVDAVVRYPNSVLPIDSKFPREQVLPLFETNDPKKLEEARKTLAETMKQLGKQISTKYIHPEHGTTDMALLFVPSETLYFEIIRNPKLCENLAKQKVFPASPNTLSVALHSISVARDYYEMAKGVETTIVEVKKSQKHFESFAKRFEEVGRGLKKTQDLFDKAGTHLGRYESAVGRLTGIETKEPQETLPTGMEPAQQDTLL